ncbi:MAG: hypothetical protein V8S95_04295 [Odoribacter sp.]
MTLLRGVTIAAIKNNEEVVASLYERILGRVSVHDIYHPHFHQQAKIR